MVEVEVEEFINDQIYLFGMDGSCYLSFLGDVSRLRRLFSSFAKVGRQSEGSRDLA